MPIVASVVDSIYTERENSFGRVLKLENNPSSEILSLLSEKPKFRL